MESPAKDYKDGSRTKTAGVIIDAWKLPIFERHLTQNGYTFKNKGKLVDDTLVLHVYTTNTVALERVIRAANDECRKTGKPT